MQKNTWWAILSALISHGVGLLLLLILSALGLSFENPTAAVMPIAFSSLFAGAILCGILLRRSGDPLSSLVGGLIYGFLPFFISLFGKGETLGLGARFLVFFLLFAVSSAVAFLFPKGRRKRLKRGYYRR